MEWKNLFGEMQSCPISRSLVLDAVEATKRDVKRAFRGRNNWKNYTQVVLVSVDRRRWPAI